MNQQPIRLYLLGTPRFEMAERNIELTAARPIALLGYLSLSMTPQPREHVIDLLWSDSTLDAGRKNLRNALWLLRKLFSDDLIDTTGDYLALSSQVWTDVQLFEQNTAVPNPLAATRFYGAEQNEIFTLYRGPLLNGVIPTNAPEFELWLTMERERLAQLFLQTIHRGLQSCRQMNDWAGVIALARRGLRYDPLQESLYCAMMEAHALRGERDLALRRYQELYKNLDRELGVKPLPETVELRNAIAHGDLRPQVDPTAGAKWWLRPQYFDFTTLPIGLSGRTLLNISADMTDVASFANMRGLPA